MEPYVVGSWHHFDEVILLGKLNVSFKEKWEKKNIFFYSFLSGIMEAFLFFELAMDLKYLLIPHIRRVQVLQNILMKLNTL